MNIRLLPVSLLATLIVSGCGQKDPAAPKAMESAAAPAAAAPAKAAPAPMPMAAAPRVIEITANDTMKFSVGDKQSGPGRPLIIEAKAGETIKIVLINAGTVPKDVMGHNLVVLKPGTDLMAFTIAAGTAKDKEFIPDALKDQVVAHTALLGPRKSDEIVLKDLKAGEYPFICSFPAHFAVGMMGTLSVK